MKSTSLLSVFFLIIVINGCTSKANSNEADIAQTVPVIKLEQTDTVLYQGYVADIQAEQNVEIRSKINGFIENILVDEGQEVKKGQVLFILNDGEHKAECSKSAANLANARAEEKAAELEVKRVKLLADKKIVTFSDYELADAKLKSAQAKVNEALSVLDNANIMLSYTKVKAPFDGIINRIPFKQGSLVGEGTLLTSVSDLKSVYAYFNVSENEYLQILESKNSNKSIGSDIKLQLSNGEEYPHAGSIQTMETEFNENTGSIALRAKFPNPSKLLKHGATGKVKLTSEVTNALIVPQKAVMEIQDKNYVFVLSKDNTVKMKSFAPKTRAEDFFIVQSGLSAGDQIVYEGIQNIQDGSLVTPKYPAADSTVVIN